MIEHDRAVPVSCCALLNCALTRGGLIRMSDLESELARFEAEIKASTAAAAGALLPPPPIARPPQVWQMLLVSSGAVGVP